MADARILDELFNVLLERKKELPEGSYTASLFQEGQEKILAKIEEEAGEVLQAARQETEERLIEESSDLIYHLLVLLASRNIELITVFEELEKRRQ